MDLGVDDPTLAEDLAGVLATRTLAAWMNAFIQADVPASPVLDAEDLALDPHTVARQMVLPSEDARYPHVKYLRTPIALPGNEPRVGLAPPLLGEHTVEILTELGYDGSARERLIASGVAVIAQ